MKRISVFAAVALALASCNNDDNYNIVDVTDDPVAAQISATIDKGSRAHANVWDENDAIGVTMGDLYANIRYVTEKGDGKFDGSTMYFRNKRDEITLSAYYPFSGDEGTARGAIEIATSVENQTAEAQRAIDFLYAKKEKVTGSDPEVIFEFTHMMSKMSITFLNGNGMNVGNITSYEIGGLKLNGTFDTATGVCAVKTDEEAEPLTIALSAGDVTHNSALPALFILPQTVTEDAVTLSITDSDNQSYTCTLPIPDNVIAAGTHYSYTITVNKSDLVVNGASISDWTTAVLEGEAF